MSTQHPGWLRRTAYRIFRLVPPGPSHAIIRLASPTFSVGAIALIEHGDTVLALRQTHRTGMSLPGGLVDRGELPHESVVREVREETGLHIEAGDIFATVFDPDLRHIDVIFRVLCDDLPHIEPSSEATGFAWLDPAEVDTETGWGEVDTATERILEAVRAAHTVSRPGRVRG